MAKSRASKGFLTDPAPNPTHPQVFREQWLRDRANEFVCPTKANRTIYSIILGALWPSDRGIPGPTLTEDEIRGAIDARRKTEGKAPYKDVFRRLRELQGEEGLTCIVKEGTKYQLQNLTLGAKREPRGKLGKKDWADLKTKYGYKCAHCGAQEPDIKLTPDHRVPRARQGTNDLSNWQPLCEQCNNIKSSACRGCALNCQTCPWAYPETYKPIVIDDGNREQLQREAKKSGENKSELANEILREYFNKKR